MARVGICWNGYAVASFINWRSDDPMRASLVHRSARLVSLAAIAFSARTAAAQQFTVSGSVRDSAGGAVRGVEIELEPGSRTARTNDRGAFTFPDVGSGEYKLSARRPGYRLLSREVTVDGDVSVALTLERAVVLPATITSVNRLGLSGVVEDTQRHPIAGARVSVTGAGREVSTDSVGAFYVEVRPGRYLVRILHDGYADRVVGVRVPPDSGRRIVVDLSTGETGSAARESATLFDLNERIIRTPGPLHFFTREELMKSGARQLSQFAGYATAHPVDESCRAAIGGESWSMPLWTIDVSDIELLEVNPRTSSAVGTSRVQTGGCPLIIAWLRK
jgi:hypothetical protein